MKPIHECAVVKDGNKRVGYFIANIGGNKVTDIMSFCWNYVYAEQFESLVKNNQVQYLVYENGGIRCRYTDEERKRLLKMPGNNKEFIEQSEENYFSLDCIFTYRHIIDAERLNVVVACSCAQITKLFGQQFGMFYFYSNKQTLDYFANRLILLNSTLRNSIKLNGNIMRISVPMILIESLFNVIDVKVLFNTSALKFIINNGVKLQSLKLIQKGISDDVLNKYIAYFDNITNKNLSSC